MTGTTKVSWLTLMLLLAPLPLRAGKPAPVTSAPRILHRVQPEYTAEALAARLEVSVLIAADLDETASLQNLRVTRGLPHGLDRQAIECVRRWRFRPLLATGSLSA